MTTDPVARDRNLALNRFLRATVCRATALALFVAGLLYWVRLIGVFEGGLWRFDTMPVWWKLAAPALAVLYPVAGVGLWLVASWGVVIWTIVFLIETIMHVGFPQLFGFDPVTVGLHAFGLALLLTLRIVLLVERSRA